jgi:hypothetical protein
VERGGESTRRGGEGRCGAWKAFPSFTYPHQRVAAVRKHRVTSRPWNEPCRTAPFSPVRSFSAIRTNCSLSARGVHRKAGGRLCASADTGSSFGGATKYQFGSGRSFEMRNTSSVRAAASSSADADPKGEGLDGAGTELSATRSSLVARGSPDIAVCDFLLIFSPLAEMLLVLCLEGVHGAGKSELTRLFAADGFEVLDEVRAQAVVPRHFHRASRSQRPAFRRAAYAAMGVDGGGKGWGGGVVGRSAHCGGIRAERVW